MMHASAFLSLWIAFSLVIALDADGWSKQSIYQVLTDRFARSDQSETAACDTSLARYCGGSWQGLIKKLDYIQGMGFTAIWISPVVTQLEANTNYGESYHGYWAQDIWTLNSHFGTEQDLQALSDELHSRGMFLMVDVVTNHMGYNGCGNCVDYNLFNPFNSKSYFHDFCLINYNDEYGSQMQTCWEGDNTISLPDLRTEDSNVRSIWRNWIAQLVSKYNVDGLRVDSAKHIEKGFHTIFEEAAGVYTLGEVLNGDPNYTLDFQNYMSGVFNYPAYFWLKRAFGTNTGDFTELVNGLNTVRANAVNTSYLGAFLENHDQERFPHVTSDTALNKNAITFTMMMDGIPIIYQGQEHHYGGDVQEGRAAIWFSEYNTGSELYAWITKLNAIRNHAISKGQSFIAYPAKTIYNSGATMAMRKGFDGNQLVSIFSSKGASASVYSISLPSSNTGFSANQEVVEVLGCVLTTVGNGGDLSVTITGGLPNVYYPLTQLQGSGICPNLSGSGSGDSGSGGCSQDAVVVTFHELATTNFGDTIKVVGSVAAIGNWNPSSAVALGASEYTSSNPLWSGTATLVARTVVEYKFIKVDSSGSVSWEADPNHTLTVGSCASATTVSSSWQS